MKIKVHSSWKNIQSMCWNFIPMDKAVELAASTIIEGDILTSGFAKVNAPSDVNPGAKWTLQPHQFVIV